MAASSGQYEIVRKIGLGILGEVLLARPSGVEDPDRQVVIKSINPDLFSGAQIDPDQLDTINVMNAHLVHPGIVPMTAFNHSRGAYYLAMKYVRGDNVQGIWHQARSTGRPLPIGASLRIVADAAAALDYAHKVTRNGKPLQIVHGNVTPRNVFVTFDGDVKVTDFGFAALKDACGRTSLGTTRGKYAYLSPEQLRSLPIDFRSDIFSLGTLLHEMLTGSPLFQQENEYQTVRAIYDCKVAPPSAKNPAVPKDLDALVLRALAADPAARYPDAAAFANTLRGFWASQPAIAAETDLARLMTALYGPDGRPNGGFASINPARGTSVPVPPKRAR